MAKNYVTITRSPGKQANVSYSQPTRQQAPSSNVPNTKGVGGTNMQTEVVKQQKPTPAQMSKTYAYGNQAIFSGRYTAEGKPIYVAASTMSAEAQAAVKRNQATGTVIQPSNLFPNLISGTDSSGKPIVGSGNKLSPAQGEVTNAGYKATSVQPANTTRGTTNEPLTNQASSKVAPSQAGYKEYMASQPDMSISQAKAQLAQAELFYNTSKLSNKELYAQMFATQDIETGRAYQQIYRARQSLEKIDVAKAKYGVDTDSLKILNESVYGSELFTFLKAGGSKQNLNIRAEEIKFSIPKDNALIPVYGVANDTVKIASVEPSPSLVQGSFIGKGLSNTAEFLKEYQYINKKETEYTLKNIQDKIQSNPSNLWKIGYTATAIEGAALNLALNLGIGFTESARDKPITTIATTALWGAGFGAAESAITGISTKYILKGGARAIGGYALKLGKDIAVTGLGAAYGLTVLENYAQTTYDKGMDIAQRGLGEEIFTGAVFMGGVMAGKTAYKAITSSNILNLKKYSYASPVEAILETASKEKAANIDLYPRTEKFLATSEEKVNRMVTKSGETMLSRESQYKTADVKELMKIQTGEYGGKSLPGERPETIYINPTGQQYRTIKTKYENKDFFITMKSKPEGDTLVKVYSQNGKKLGLLGKTTIKGDVPFYGMSEPVTAQTSRGFTRPEATLDIKEDVQISRNIFKDFNKEYNIDITSEQSTTKVLTAKTKAPAGRAADIELGRPVIEVKQKIDSINLYPFKGRYGPEGNVKKAEVMGYYQYQYPEDYIAIRINKETVKNRDEFFSYLRHEGLHARGVQTDRVREGEFTLPMNKEQKIAFTKQALKDFEELIYQRRKRLDISRELALSEKSISSKDSLFDTKTGLKEISKWDKDIRKKGKANKEWLVDYLNRNYPKKAHLDEIFAKFAETFPDELRNPTTPTGKLLSSAVYDIKPNVVTANYKNNVGRPKKIEPKVNVFRKPEVQYLGREYVSVTQKPTEFKFVDYPPQNQPTTISYGEKGSIHIEKVAQSNIRKVMEQKGVIKIRYIKKGSLEPISGKMQNNNVYSSPSDISSNIPSAPSSPVEPLQIPVRPFMGVQSLFRAGNDLPSVELQAGKKLYGFSNVEEAKQWAKDKGYKKVFQVTTDKYDLDPQLQKGATFLRKTAEGRRLNDNEYIIHNVLSEKEVGFDSSTTFKEAPQTTIESAKKNVVEISSAFSRQIEEPKRPNIYAKIEVPMAQNRLVLPIKVSRMSTQKQFYNTNMQPTQVGISELSQSRTLLFEQIPLEKTTLQFENKQITPQQYEIGAVNQFKSVNINKMQLAPMQQQEIINRIETRQDITTIPKYENPINFRVPSVIVPRIPAPVFGFPGVEEDNKQRKKKRKKGKTALTPTLRSITFGLTGKTTKISIRSGLGERFVNLFKRRK